mmetsp:Transcript_20353/g.43960  ORF Transcript_20353/g.43960 Transcript_20353/m.43960 type:complete len:84 (+) Transcript_20353:484-735(+)
MVLPNGSPTLRHPWRSAGTVPGSARSARTFGQQVPRVFLFGWFCRFRPLRYVPVPAPSLLLADPFVLILLLQQEQWQQQERQR